MEGPAQKSLALILARELASNLAVPMWIVEADGTLVFINEAAERMLGIAYHRMADMDRAAVRDRLQFSRPDGTPIPRDDLPLIVSMAERRPVEECITAVSFEGVKRVVTAVCYPLLTTPQNVVGGVAMFWEEDTAS